MILEASYLDKLFEQHPHLPGRFFAFLASYQARRLKQVTEMVASAAVEVQGLGGDKVKIADVFANPAYMGIFRKFMFKAAEENPEAARACRGEEGDAATPRLGSAHPRRSLSGVGAAPVRDVARAV